MLLLNAAAKSAASFSPLLLVFHLTLITFHTQLLLLNIAAKSAANFPPLLIFHCCLYVFQFWGTGGFQIHVVKGQQRCHLLKVGCV